MPRCYSQLTLADRRRHQLVERKVPINEMARQLGRLRSTAVRRDPAQCLRAIVVQPTL